MMLDFSIITIRKVAAPVKQEGGDVWHQYVIGNEITTITGTRKGGIKEVTGYVNSCVERLNLRFKALPKYETSAVASQFSSH